MIPEPAPYHSLVIPAYNEEARIIPLLESIAEFDGELIIVCDGTDRTAEIVKTISARRTDLIIRCLEFDHRLGKGGGVRAGLAAARAPLVGYFDADGSTSPGEMLRLFSALDSADGAIGSRWVPGSNLTVRQGWMRRMESRGFNLIMRILYGLPYHDTQCGAKVFRKAAVDAVLSSMLSNGFEFDVELLWRLRSAGYTIVEVPIEWRNKGDSRVKKRDMIGMLAGLIRVRLHRGGA
ncbi:dolichyl-phosphate beta-glucosyltransferase [Methanoregula sp.]|jgi:glycosyltransferase involved in cell wall biosynthesis|uniref:dolichyl-phosphate beta-glucosyltransferase n=1 Tax=Methanoregula sp. TaxID=2052170 RepID=UPI002637ABF5|nr:dolichyl-phosphate beta-glucosyltransferase [Methanoregula sp.]MDD5142706.1 glycosyltransferase family 2 protein [Methanoregula sp.]